MNLELRPDVTVSSVVGADQVPDAVRSRSTIADPDYVDLFTITTPPTTTTSPEKWARAVLEEAPVSRRNARFLWRLMGLRLGPRHSADCVQGWKIAACENDWLRLATGSWYMSAEAVCSVEDGRLSFSLSLHYERSVAALVWALVSGPHQRAVPAMLRQAVELMTA
jgi:hypothetical protein